MGVRRFHLDRRQCLAALSSLLFGQLLSAANAGTTILFNEVVVNGQLPVHLFPSELVYHALLVLTLAALPWSYRILRRLPPSVVLAYAVLGVVDFGANVAVLKAFEYLCSVSVAVVISTSALFAMLLAMVVFGRRYGAVHFAGAAVVVVGLVCINASKYVDDGAEASRSFWFGMVLALAGAVGYAVSNTINEYVAGFETGYPIAALTGMGLYGSLASALACQLTAYGRHDRDLVLAAGPRLQLLLGGFVACMLALYLAIPAFIQSYSAVHLNLNLLTVDVYVLVYNVAIQGRGVRPLYMAGFVLALVGMTVFNLRQPVDRLPPPDALALKAEATHKTVIV